MKKLSRIVTAVLVAALVVYAGVVTLTAPKLPPVREAGAWYIDGTSPMGFVELVKAADVIAHVRIGDWLGEDSHYTVVNFEATAVEVYKGELPEKFIVAQSGDLEDRFYTWFTYGNEAFLFLDVPKGEYDYENTYRLTDGDRTISYVSYNDSGDAFIVPFYTDVFKYVPGAAYYDHSELRDYLVKNDPELWRDRSVGSAYTLERVVDRIATILAETSTEPPEVSISVGGEVVTLEPYYYSWDTLFSPNKYRENLLEGEHPLDLSDEEWDALPYLQGEPDEVEVLCRVEPGYIGIQAWHESYRGADDPWDTTLVERKYVKNDDGAFEIESSSGYVYVLFVTWNSNPESDTPQFKGSAEYAFRVGKTKKIAADKVTLASFDKYPAAQLSNLLKGTPRAEIIDRYGEPDIAAGSYDLWLTEDDKFMRVAYLYPDYNTVRTIELTEGLPSFPPLLITIGGESYPVQQGTTSWQSRDGGYEACSSAPSDWDWSERTIYTDATEAVITLNVSDRLAERIDVSIDGGLISAKTAGEPFELYARSARIYEFRVSVGDAEGEGMQSLFSGTAHCAVRIAPSGE